MEIEKQYQVSQYVKKHTNKPKQTHTNKQTHTHTRAHTHTHTHTHTQTYTHNVLHTYTGRKNGVPFEWCPACPACPQTGQDEVVSRLERILANVTGTEPGTASSPHELTHELRPSCLLKYGGRDWRQGLDLNQRPLLHRLHPRTRWLCVRWVVDGSRARKSARSLVLAYACAYAECQVYVHA